MLPVRRGDAARQRASAAHVVVEALGRRRKVWFAYEDLHSRITERRQAAYFDLGVEHGIAAAWANQLPRASKSARAIAEHLVQEVVGTEVAPRVRLEAVLIAAWALLGAKTGRPASLREVKAPPRG